MDSHDSFPQFNHFPLEIRRLIWKSCLPRRIAEEDFPFTLLDGKDGRQACWPVRTLLQNARVPLLAMVCREARAMVFEWGGHQVSQDTTSLDSIWLQSTIDRACHLNWTRRRDEEYYSINNCDDSELENCVVIMVIYRAHHVYDMRASFVGELPFPFDLRKLMDSMSLAPTDTDLLGSEYMASTIPSIHLDPYRSGNRPSISLFGLQGDAPVQTVNFDDVAQLRQLYELFNSDPALREAEPHVEKLFDLILSPVFHKAVFSWQEKVRWLLQVTVWRQLQKGDDLETFGGTDLRSAWTPPLPEEQELMQMDQFMPNEEHPWWREHAERYIPQVVPQIMVRLCDNECYREERRSEMLGEVWFPNHMVCKVRKRVLGRIIPWAGELTPWDH
ncbi:hypothetical protein DL98DRAFT_627258 [Cadophora sp. DSE1049]|nr:hypothetical protein DL98DRAFT_627258 [Cadophora sp. DSE1049]